MVVGYGCADVPEAGKQRLEGGLDQPAMLNNREEAYHGYVALNGEVFVFIHP